MTAPSRRNEVPALLERVRQANPDWEQVAVLDSLSNTIAARNYYPFLLLKSANSCGAS